MDIKFSVEFKKQHRKIPKKIKEKLVHRLEFFLINPYNPYLNNHALTGNYRGFRSINITGDWRALYTEERKDGILFITFKFLGTHSQLYR